MLNKLERKRQGKQQTPSLLSIDSQGIKSGPLTSLEKGIDGNKKINGRKRHVITDILGPIRESSGRSGPSGRRVHSPGCC